nr:MAG TPA: hypothetical protein [Caudoviricetes sp.]
MCFASSLNFIKARAATPLFNLSLYALQSQNSLQIH